jgi:hypothetical protein
MKTMSVSFRASSISARWSSAAWRPIVGVTAGSESSGQLATNVNLQISFLKKQCLRVRVGRDELDIFQSPEEIIRLTAFAPASTDANYFDHGVVVALTETHELPLGYLLHCVRTSTGANVGEQTSLKASHRPTFLVKCHGFY